MDAPNYMSKIEEVSQGIASRNSLRAVGVELKDAWENFEDHVKNFGYDVLGGYAGVEPRMQRMCDLLYRMPGADWETDCRQLVEKNREYGGSWHRRGGAGAFFMLSRKYDRVEVAMARCRDDLGVVVNSDTRDEGVLDDLGDLRRYLILCIAWLRAEKAQKEITF